MNNSHQARSGFKTFIFVFLISLGVFFSFYYLTSNPNNNVDIENYQDKDTDVLGESTKNTTAFETLSEQKMDVPKKTVLSGTTASPETTQSTSVPVTGVTGITYGLLASLAVLTWGIYTIYIGPRKLALSSFEKKITRN